MRFVFYLPAAPHHQMRIKVEAALDFADHVFAMRPDTPHTPPDQLAGMFAQPRFGGFGSRTDFDQLFAIENLRQLDGVAPHFGAFGHKSKKGMKSET
jgi:hypothetical protein